MSNENDDIIDELVKDLQNNPPCQSQSTQITVNPTKDISEDKELETYINENAQKSNDVLFQVITTFAKDIGDDPERAEAFSKLLKSNTDLLKLLNDRLVKQRNNQLRKDLQKMKNEGQTMEKYIEAQKSITLSRDEMFKELLKDADVVETDVEEISSDSA